MSNKSLEGKISLITGGASGIGKATAIAMAREGSVVIVADLEEDKCNAVVEQIHQEGNKASAHPVDVSDEQSIIKISKNIRSEFGRLDVAFNNAGIGGNFRKTDECTFKEWSEVLSVNLTGVWLCMKYEIQFMLENGGGNIVNTASVAGLIGMGYAPAYTASKHGVIGLTKNAALEYAKRIFV